MIITTLKIEESPFEGGSQIEVHIRSKNEGLATEMEAEYTERLITKITGVVKEVAESMGTCESIQTPLNIYKRYVTDEDDESEL